MRPHRFLGPLLVALLATCRSGEVSGVLLQDDFSDPRSGWPSESHTDFSCGYDSGEYFVEANQPEWLAWSTPGKRFDDVTVEVDARLVDGPEDNHFGLICRYVNPENFYYFAISSDGYYAIFKREAGEELVILTGDGSGMLFSTAIRQGEEPNHIQVVCRGDQLSLYANGTLLETVTDPSLSRGDIGLGVGTAAEGGVRVHFDNLLVTGFPEPPEEER